METKQKRDTLVDIQTWLGYDRIMNVNPIGYSGGLALMWKNSVYIDFKYVDKHLLDFHVQFGKFGFLFLVFMVNLLGVTDLSCGKDYLG